MTQDGILLFVRNSADDLLVGASVQNAAKELTSKVAAKIRFPVASCRLALGYQAAVEALDYFSANDYERLAVFVMATGDQDYEVDDLVSLLQWHATQQPRLRIRWGGAIGFHSELIDILAEHAANAEKSATKVLPQAETALVLIGRGSNDPEHNAGLVRIARLLSEGREYGWVEAGFYNSTQPDVPATLTRAVQLGAKQIIVLPYLYFDPTTLQGIHAQVRRFEQAHLALSILVAQPLGNHPLVSTLVAECGQELLQLVPSGMAHSHHNNAMDILPPRYQGNVRVSAAPMGSAPILYDEEGRVAWDRMWGNDDPGNPFCELALAGGPPHRGDLLEPVNSSDVTADYANYVRVLAELTRGIQLTTELPTQLSPKAGWIGVGCESDEMAIWLLRAIIVENVSVRREGSVLYLPAGPNFRLEHEIKNVITVLAKTHHYWLEHKGR